MRAPSIRSSMQGGLAQFWTRPSVLFVVVALGVCGSFAMDWIQADAAMAAMARERGATLFRLVDLTRDWNARHGGVYVPVTPDTQPNPHLEHPRRELRSDDGRILTMINPAYMTRQIAEIAQQAEGIQLHLTSLQPIRPGNAPDAWEAAALARFETGVGEVSELIPGAEPVHRYMAPLRIRQPCMQCHEKQGYVLGQIRGGISVTMPAASLLHLRDMDRIRSGAVHLLTLGIAAALLNLLFMRNRSHVAALESLAAEQEQVIIERTRDLSQAKDELERQLANRELAAAVFENAGEAIIITDDQGNLVEVNPAFSAMSGYEAGEVLGRPASILKSGRHAPEFYAAMWDEVRHGKGWQGEVWNRRKDGEIFVVWLSITRVTYGGQAARYVGTLTDITRSKQLEEELRHRAYHDPLTDLPNRALFSDRLRVAINQAQRHQRGFALCFIDLDAFKSVNDTLGHAAGDELLVEAARRMRLGVRAADTVARLGGDEFAAILTEVGSRREVEEVAERIVSDIARPFVLQAGSAQISCSMGIALFPDHGCDSDALQRSADTALYAVKESTRNGFYIAPNGAVPPAA